MSSADNNDDEKVYSLEEVQNLADDKTKCVMIINNNVYDVLKFVEEHPGGDEVLKEQLGKDATNAFEDIGHSMDAREQMKQYKIGKLRSGDAKESRRSQVEDSNRNTNVNQGDSGTTWTKWIVPFVIAVAAAVLFKLLVKPEGNINRPSPTL